MEKCYRLGYNKAITQFLRRKQMKIECTKEEFKILFDLVYAGNVLVNGMRNYEERVKEYSEMEQTIFKLAESFGLTDTVEYNEEFKEYMPTRQYEDAEEGINTYIDQYDDKVFWEELILRLARRDALNELGDINPEMTKQELNKKQEALEEMYEDEIFYHGIERLKIKELE